jgi:hypothetical protein
MTTPTTVTFLVNNLLDRLETGLTPTTTMVFPVSNLKDRAVQNVARFLGVTDTILTINLGTAQTIGAVAWVFTNLRAGATVEVRVGTTNVFLSGTVVGTVTIDRPTLITGGKDFHLVHYVLFTPVSRQYVFLKLNDPGNPDNFTDLGRVFVGPTVSFPLSWPGGANFRNDYELRWVDDGTKHVTAGGQLVPSALPPRRQVSFEVSYLKEVEIYPAFFRLLGQIGTDLDIWVLLRPGDPPPLCFDQAIYGQLMEGGGFRHPLFPFVNTNQIVIQESR